MAIAFQANSGAASGNSAAPSVSSVNASGANRFSLIGIYANGDETISAISRGGQTPTLIRRYNIASGSSNTLWLFGLVNPATGVQTISVTKSASSLWAIAESVYTGVDQATPYGTEAVAENSSASPITVDVAAAVGQMVADVAIAASNTVTVGAGQTERVNFDDGGNMGYRRFCMSDEAGAATVTMSWAPSGPSGRSGIIALPLNAAGGSAAALSSPTPSGTLGTGTTATVGATTDQNTGTGYVVVDTAANLSGVTATQIKAGQKNNSTAALAAGSVAVSSTSFSVGVSGLSPNTAYSYAIVQNNANGDSNIVTGTFTTANVIDVPVTMIFPLD